MVIYYKSRCKEDHSGYVKMPKIDDDDNDEEDKRNEWKREGYRIKRSR